MSWVRVESAIWSDARMIRAGFWGGIVFLAAVTMAKQRGWRGGRVPKEDFDAPMISHHVNAVTAETVTREIEAGIVACVRVGLLLDDGKYYVIRSWNKYQQDPGNAERQERTRQRRRAAGRVPVQPIQPLRTSDVTGRDGTEDLEPVPGSQVLSSPAPHTTLADGAAALASEADAAAPPVDPLEAAREAARQNGTAYVPKAATSGNGTGQRAVTAPKPPQATPIAKLAAEAKALGNVAPMAEDEREAIRLGQRLADLGDGDERHDAAAGLIAERPRGEGWVERAKALLAGDGEPWEDF